MATTVEVVKQKELAKPFAEVREKAVIHFGEECKLKSMELFESFGLPGGLLPLQDIQEGGFVEETGFVWMISKKQQYHFKKADRHCSYAETISCYLKPKKMTKISGVKARDMMIWVPINEISVDDAAEPKIHFKSVGGLSRSFNPELFGRGA
ncbi:hypothetical protein GOP47_0003294 [Adiantum capillus-veneris]|uniref:Uncharacterized protein n=1 Tax=Adiantum capillus-veneris TaxID=13818 RepID=A0A9D4VBP8_ADICA|nr:hypothetical protein GOP47_0003294 [Adiantum capillus-veneris]